MLLQMALFIFYGWVVFQQTHTHLFIHSSISGHLRSLCILAIVNNFLTNIAMCVSFQISVFVIFGKITRSGIYGGCTVLHSTSSVRGFQCLHVLTETRYLFLCDDSCPRGCYVGSRCGFDLYFSQDCDVEGPLHILEYICLQT